MPSRSGAVGRQTPIAVVVKGYPRLSETFIAQEILELERRGLDQRIVSLRRPTDTLRHDLHHQIRAPVLYLPEYLHDEPERVERAREAARRLPGYGEAYAAFRRDFRRDVTTNRWRRFGQACVLASELDPAIRHIHTHFLHTPASVARYTAIMRGLNWSFSAHARDIWTSPDWELAEKLPGAPYGAVWGVTCTRANLDRLRALSGKPDLVDLVYHGLDLSRFPMPPERPDRDGGDPTDPVRIVTVGRAVEKKGFDVLLTALARLPEGLCWRATHVGGGKLSGDLARMAASLGIADRVRFLGPADHATVVGEDLAGDLFVLPSRIADDGDRDGLPNVLMEAQAVGVPCVATRLSAIPELIEDGRTGLLVAPEDPAGLAAAIERLIRDPALRRRLGLAGSRRVRERFRFEDGVDEVARRFGFCG